MSVPPRGGLHMATWLKPYQLLLIRMTGEMLRSDPCRLTLEVSQEADHLGQRAIMTRGESVQTLQSIKLIYQPCSWT